MDYIELTCSISPYSDAVADILVAELAELGFDGFTDTDGKLCAYIQANKFIFEEAKKIQLNAYNAHYSITYSFQFIKSQNWNAVWEQNFEPVIIQDHCIIRAPFHQGIPKALFEIIIEPKMSFGTGHHETTSLMIEKLLQKDLTGKRVLDMGCGTGILAILSSMKGAKSVTAIDIDDWAYLNTQENINKNNAKNITPLLGGAELLKGEAYHLILANINLNILLHDMNVYVKSLLQKGSLIMSGIYKSDLEKLRREAGKNNLALKGASEKNKWVAVEFIKT